MMKFKKISRLQVIELIADCRLKTNDNETLLLLLEIEEEDYQKLSPTELRLAVIENLTFYYQGMTNGFLSDVYHILTGKRVEVVGDIAELYACDCCGKKTLTEKIGIDGGGWDICGFCRWEDTGITDENRYCGCNHGSIKEYRQRIADNPNFYYREMWKKTQNYLK